MTQSLSEPVPDAELARAENALIAHVQDLTTKTWTVTSPDGHVTVVAGGDQRLQSVTFNTPDAPAGLLSRAATVAAQEALSQARRDTVAAMRDLPGLPTELRTLLQSNV